MLKEIKCRICNVTSTATIYEIGEPMYGMLDKFEYFQCPNCECLQIDKIPLDMAKYYQSNYYSLNSLSGKISKTARFLRDRYVMTKWGVIGYLINRKKQNDALNSLVRLAPLTTSSILDVGCGTGAEIESLAMLGFTKLLGIDPNLSDDRKIKEQVFVKKMELSDVDGKWDVIMMNHSLEHIYDQQMVFKNLKRLLSPSGKLIIRIPTVSSDAWKLYGTHWIQLDAPRHFYLHSLKSIGLLASEFGFIIQDRYSDSSDFQFWGSEQWKAGIHLKSDKSYKINSYKFDISRSIFDKKTIKEYKAKAKLVNANFTGDQIVLYLCL
jgi:SAM-dependent methyltransferase